MPASNTGRRPTKAQLKTERAAKRALQLEAQARSARRRRLTLAIAPVVVVILVIGILVGVKLASGGNSNSTTSAAGTLTEQVTGVPLSVLNTVGAGSGASGPTAKLSGPALSANGLPRVLYVGAEWCPYCATERWPLALAVSRFGTLTNLGQTSSSSTDVYPNTATLSFHGSHFTSTVLSFSGMEIEDNQEKPLDSLDASDQALFSSTGKSSFPFIDVGGVYQFGVQLSPSLLAGKTHDEIAQAMHDPSSAIGKAVDGAANVLTAAICTLTDNSPATVCNSAGVKAAAALLTSTPTTTGG